MARQMVDIAYDFIKEHQSPVSFIDIWNEVCKEKDFNEAQKEDKIADFFSDMSLDDRFISVEGNKWDIRSRRKFDEVCINADALAIDTEGDE